MFIGKSFNKPRLDKTSGQELFYLSPIWLNEILFEVGKIPNKYSFETALERINNLKRSNPLKIDYSKTKFDLLLKNDFLAAGAFIVSMDFECRGMQSGKVGLCMSEKYIDFLKFFLKVAKKWNWANQNVLSKVDVSYSRNLGINASDQYELTLSIYGLSEIYSLAGPLMDSFKDKCVKFQVNRSKNYINLGHGLNKNKTKDKIYLALKKSPNLLISTDLMFVAGVNTDVVLNHLHSLEEVGQIFKKRNGKRYLWGVRNAN